MEHTDYKQILNSVGKTMSKIGKNTAIVSGVATAGMSPFTIPLALNAMFLGVISKSDLDNYEYIVDKDEKRIILKHKSYNPVVDEDYEE